MKKLIFTLTLLTTASVFVYSQETVSEASKKLEQVIEEVENFEPYDRKQYPLGNFSEERYKASADFAASKIISLKNIDQGSLSESERISLNLLLFELEDRRASYALKMHWNPITTDEGFHINLNYEIESINSYEEALNYLRKLQAIPLYTKQHITLMRKGLKAGISQPKVIFKNYASTYNRHIVQVADSSDFFSPLNKLPGVIPDLLKDSIITAGRALVRDSVIPSFKKIKTFFEEEYIPNTRDAIGVSDTPGGKEYYQNRINFFTTTNEYTAEDIHELGKQEVSRIKSEMMKILEETGFEGTLSEFMDFLRTDPQFYVTSGEELLKEARDIAKRIDAQLPAFFKTLPRRPYGVIKVPDAIAPIYTAGRYSGQGSETQPGYYLVNTYKLESRPLYALPALTAHEAVPGHHLQGSLNRELGDSIPKFRRRMYLSAYGEGWALYTENLAEEMGIYRTPYERFGKLTYEMWRACRLVVDTGIHAFGWSRQEVVDYMTENTALSIHEINTETDRYIGWPGQAISYKIGELKIRELRALAEKELGENFDIREFHERILEQGTVTLPILEERIKAYIHQKNSANTTP